MKKPTQESKATGNKEEKCYISIPLYDIKDIKPEVVSKTWTRYHLGEGVLMDICEGEDYDYGSLNVYGLVVSVTFRIISKGQRAGEIFVSYPQYKAKDGKFKPHVRNFSKPLNDAIKKVIEMHYS